ncbi:MAG: right-handed parallel beta-helix repeat-containing protein [Planctomycetes bacterium]|nr:right-handed parallel beta-helix repeat-containing protein [Planctomycetota bacterium]
MRKTALYIALLLTTSNWALAQNTFHVDKYPGDNDREIINAALLAMKDIQGQKTLIFSKREYIIQPHDKNTFDAVIGVDGVSDLSIEGNGAILVAKDALDCQKGYFFKIAGFRNITIKDLTLSYRPLPFIQGRIVTVNQKENHVTVSLDKGFNSVDELKVTPNSKFWSRVGIKGKSYLPKPGSPSWLEVKTYAGGIVGHIGTTLEQIEIKTGFFDQDQVVNGQYNWAIGDPIVIWKRGAQDGFFFEKGQKLLLKNIAVNSALHFSIKLRGIFDGKITGCSVEPIAGGMVSGCADGIDVQQSKGITIENCRIMSCGDDMISFLNHGIGHGYNGVHSEKKLPKPYPETNIDVVIKNNILTGGNRNGILLLASNAKVEGNKVLSARQYGIKFTGDNTSINKNSFIGCGSFAAYKHIKDELDTGIVCSDEWYQSNIKISGNVFSDWRNMPAILMKAVKDATITGNKFSVSDSSFILNPPINQYLKRNYAICITNGDCNAQSLGCVGINIVSNTFRAPGLWRKAQEAIAINGTHKDITIARNSLQQVTPDRGQLHE